MTWDPLIAILRANIAIKAIGFASQAIAPARALGNVVFMAIIFATLFGSLLYTLRRQAYCTSKGTVTLSR